VTLRNTILSTLIGVIVGSLVTGLLLLGRREPTGRTPANNTDAQVARAETVADPEAILTSQLATIRNELAFERDARFAMAEELDLVWEEFASLSAPTETDPNAPAPDPPPALPQQQVAQRVPQKWFDSDSLLTAGVSQRDVVRLRELYEAEQLDELYLRDAATREGWLSTPRFRKDLQQLKQDLRVELGDEDYDRVTYASGRYNRVEVDDVLQNSAADTIGLRKGDVIVRYDGQLMLSPPELRRATARGSADQATEIDVLRGSETLRFYVPRGPLGVRIGQTRRPPE
jgi:hypothetical protein